MKLLAFILDVAAARATAKSLKLPAQELRVLTAGETARFRARLL